MSMKTPPVSRDPKEWDCTETAKCTFGYVGIQGLVPVSCIKYEVIETCCKKPGTMRLEPDQKTIERCVTSVKYKG